MEKTALISPCGNYRYKLGRFWDKSKPIVMFIMLNPSTADAKLDDPTIRRCINFAKSWGYGGLYVGNLFSFRSTDPKNILTCDNPIGEHNLHYLNEMSLKSSSIICAWGNSTIISKILKKNKNYAPLKEINNLNYLELSKDGTPKHPLYLKGDLFPKKYK